MKAVKLYILCLAFFLLQSCFLFEGPTTCSDEFVSYSIKVFDIDGQPADSVQITGKRKTNGDILEICGEEDLCNTKINGSYTIMHDGFHGKISNHGETIVVEGTKDEFDFNEEFLFRSGGCSIQKVAGPDTVSLSSK